MSLYVPLKTPVFIPVKTPLSLPVKAWLVYCLCKEYEVFPHHLWYHHLAIINLNSKFINFIIITNIFMGEIVRKGVFRLESTVLPIFL